MLQHIQQSNTKSYIVDLVVFIADNLYNFASSSNTIYIKYDDDKGKIWDALDASASKIV